MVKNFRFVEPGLALSGVPQSPEEVDWLAAQGIRTVVSLEPPGEETAARLRESGLEWKPLFFSDFGEDVPEGFAAMLGELEEAAAPEHPVLVHCSGGGGRAGTTYAAYLIRKGVPVEEALVRVPGVQRDVQKAFLRGFAAGLRAGGPAM